jgi:hypothetical protein
MRLEDKLFALINAETDVPCFAAIRLSVSPDTTVCVPLEFVEAVEDALEEAEPEELEVFENFRF